MTRDDLLVALLAERFGPLPSVQRERRRRPMPLSTALSTGRSQGLRTDDPQGSNGSVDLVRARRWVCVMCGGPARSDGGWRCPICRRSAVRPAPEVDRERVS